MPKIKFFASVAFLAVVAGVLLFSNDKSRAQSGKSSAKRAEVLEKIADYKGWKQVRKPETQTGLSILKTGAVPIFDSSAMG